MYIKKAGTVILAVSIVMWAIMTFPALSEEKARPFQERLATLSASFLAEPVVKEFFSSDSDLKAFEDFEQRFRAGEQTGLIKENRRFYALAGALAEENVVLQEDKFDAPTREAANLYRHFMERKQALEKEKQTEHLRNTIGGRLGVALETLSRPLNFDWRTNIALIGGFSAKEVVVSTLGTAYSLGEVTRGAARSLAEELRREAGWNQLTAFSLILFVMLYAPCSVTLVVMRKETGTWKWPIFAMIYTTSLAYCVALLVQSVGSLLHLGTG